MLLLSRCDMDFISSRIGVGIDLRRLVRVIGNLESIHANTGEGFDACSKLVRQAMAILFRRCSFGPVCGAVARCAIMRVAVSARFIAAIL